MTLLTSAADGDRERLPVAEVAIEIAPDRVDGVEVRHQREIGAFRPLPQLDVEIHPLRGFLQEGVVVEADVAGLEMACRPRPWRERVSWCRSSASPGRHRGAGGRPGRRGGNRDCARRRTARPAGAWCCARAQGSAASGFSGRYIRESRSCSAPQSRTRFSSSPAGPAPTFGRVALVKLLEIGGGHEDIGRLRAC